MKSFVFLIMIFNFSYIYPNSCSDLVANLSVDLIAKRGTLMDLGYEFDKMRAAISENPRFLNYRFQKYDNNKGIIAGIKKILGIKKINDIEKIYLYRGMKIYSKSKDEFVKKVQEFFTDGLLVKYSFGHTSFWSYSDPSAPGAKENAVFFTTEMFGAMKYSGRTPKSATKDDKFTPVLTILDAKTYVQDYNIAVKALAFRKEILNVKYAFEDGKATKDEVIRVFNDIKAKLEQEKDDIVLRIDSKLTDGRKVLKDYMINTEINDNNVKEVLDGFTAKSVDANYGYKMAKFGTKYYRTRVDIPGIYTKSILVYTKEQGYTEIRNPNYIGN